MDDDAGSGSGNQAIVDRILTEFFRLKPVRLTEPERERMGSGLFVGMYMFVMAVSMCTGDPGLWRRQQLALFWDSLSILLERLARMARDTYLWQQDQVLKQAMAPIHKLRHDARDPTLTEEDRLPGSPLWQRYETLMPALLILRQVYAHRTRRAGRRVRDTGRITPSGRGRRDWRAELRARLFKKKAQ